MRVAVVGTGISGLIVAYLLRETHDVVVFESEDRIGGHTHTVTVEEDGRSIAVDTGFIVFNRRNYPNFSRLLDRLGVDSKPSSMSFSVRDDVADFEYRASSLDTLFAQRRNLLRPDLYRLLVDAARFYREAPRDAAAGDRDTPLGAYLDRRRYSRAFARRHLLPMAAAVWSAGRAWVEEFPLGHLVDFFGNHGMLQFRDRPEWRTVAGGSHAYVRAMVAPFADRVRTGCPVAAVRRGRDGVFVTSPAAREERFDKVVLAAHSDQSLSLLADSTEREREILGAMPYTRNDVVLHTDASLLPRRRKAWSSWNVHLDAEEVDRVATTYYMNRLQGFTARNDYCVTLNRTDRIAPERVLGRFTYDHPLYSAAAVAARQRHDELHGENHTYYCGAYWGYGFHEDGLVSGLKVAEAFGSTLR